MDKLKHKIALIALSLLIGTISNAQNRPIAESLEQYVNPFTGDFSYAVPLLEVSGPNGESFPLSATYTAGIRMNQEASWIGLGWNTMSGEITRQVNGIPDDWKGKIVEINKSYGSTIDPTKHFAYYGPIYYKDLSTHIPAINVDEKLMDIGYSEHGISGQTPLIELPNYDTYQISGPGVMGNLTPHLFDFAEFHHDFYNDALKNAYPFSKKLQFSMEGTTANDVLAPDVYNSGFSASGVAVNSMETPQSLYTGSNAANYPNNKRFFHGDYDDAENRMHEPYYIEYFSNQEIIDHSNGITPITGFLDYQQNFDRTNATDFDKDGIGAFRVTLPNGKVYHYSLPVYTKSETSKTVQLLGNMEIDNLQEYNKIQKQDIYANSWKLTAITGLDYADANNNGIADDGDTGYWIALDYELWSDNFNWRSPYFGYHFDLGAKHVPADADRNKISQAYYPEGIVTEGTSQLYYLNFIKTATQTAFFIKSTRSDAHSVEANGQKTPKLLLDKIILIHNKDNINPTIATPKTMANGGYLNLGANTNPKNGTILNSKNYTDNQSTIDDKLLRMVDFQYDYHLAKGLYNNVNNTWAGGTNKFHGLLSNTQDFIYSDHSTASFSTNNALESGKLTLNKIVIHGEKAEQLFPAFEFDYSSNNPDYQHDRTDYFGFYKHDFNSSSKGGYVTGSSKDYIDAWSLTKITTPLGGEITVEYEADKYNNVVANNFQSMGYSNTSYNTFNTVNAIKNKPIRLLRLDHVTNVNYHDPNLAGVKPHLQLMGVGFVDDQAAALLDESSIIEKKIVGKFYFNNLNLPSLKFIQDDELELSNLDVAANTADLKLENPQGNNASGSNHLLSPDNGLNYYYHDDDLSFMTLYLNQAYGGGIRVKNIALKELETNETFELAYTYKNGTITSEPNPYALRPKYHNGNPYPQKSFQASDLLVLPPVTGYDQVNIQYTSQAGNDLGSKKIEFINYSDPFKIRPAHEFVQSSNPSDRYIIKIEEDKSLFGKVFKSRVLNNKGKVLAQQVFEYEHNTNKIEEVFYSRIFADFDPSTYLGNYTMHIGILHRKSRTLLSKKISTKDGITSEVHYEERNKLTGTPTKVNVSTPIANGLASPELDYRTTKRLAYEDYPNMGPKSVDPSYTNQVTEVSLNKSSRTSMLNGVSSIYANQLRKRGFDGSTNGHVTSSENIPWSNVEVKKYIGQDENDPGQWQKNLETTLLNEDNGVLEAKGMNNNYTAFKYGYDNQFQIAQGAGVNYASCAYSGFENKETHGSVTFFESEVNANSGIQKTSAVSQEAHTGNHYVEVAAGSNGPIFKSIVNNETINGETYERGLQTGRTYHASVWLHQDSDPNARLVASLDGNYSVYQSAGRNDISSVQIGDWIQLNLTLEVPEDYASSGGTMNDFRVYLSNSGSSSPAWFDDFMVKPIDASMSGSCYDERRGLVTHTLDNYNFYTRYVYDAAGAVKEVYVETPNGERLASRTEFEFLRDME